jgi:hypothetical protein
VAIHFAVEEYEAGLSLYRFSLIKTRDIYITPRRCNIMRITTTTIKMWIQPPVCGKLGLMLRPKKPSSHNIIKITMIVHSMLFLLLSDSFSMMMDGGLCDDHRLVDLEPTGHLAYFGPRLILQQTLSDSIHRPGNFDLRQLGEIN